MGNILKSLRLDHQIMKSRYPLFTLGYALGILFGVLSKTPIFGAAITMIMAAPLAGQYFSIYDKNNLEKLYGVLPLSKSDVVTGRYLYALCIVIINGIIGTILAYVVSIVTNRGMNAIESLSFISIAFFYCCLMIAVIYPLYFKFTFSKVYIFSNLPFYVIVVAVLAATRVGKALAPTSQVVQYLSSNLMIAATGFGLGLVLLALSGLLSSALVEGSRPAGLPAEASIAEQPGTRMFFADNLRTWMVILVVLQHLAEVYGLYLFLMLNQAYFMGMLFLLSGYFTPGSYERKGPGRFLVDRLLRLGIPTIAYVFILKPLETWGSHLITHKPMGGLFALDQMWFVVMLLVFDLGYLAWRLIVKKPERPAPENHHTLTAAKAALFTLVLAAATYCVRIFVPYGIPVLQFPSLGYLAQYLLFFLIGMLAFRRGWLKSVAGSLGKVGFVFAVLSTAILFPVAVFVGSGSRWIGYGSWQSAAFALWDSIFAVGISLAYITFFRRFLDGGRKLGRFLSRQSYAVYVIHVPVIVFLIPALSGLRMQSPLKFCLAAVFCLPLSFGAAWLVRKIPGVKKIT